MRVVHSRKGPVRLPERWLVVDSISCASVGVLLGRLRGLSRVAAASCSVDGPSCHHVLARVG
jgi:hypothetical protein